MNEQTGTEGQSCWREALEGTAKFDHATEIDHFDGSTQRWMQIEWEANESARKRALVWSGPITWCHLVLWTDRQYPYPGRHCPPFTYFHGGLSVSDKAPSLFSGIFFFLSSLSLFGLSLIRWYVRAHMRRAKHNTPTTVDKTPRQIERRALDKRTR